MNMADTAGNQSNQEQQGYFKSLWESFRKQSKKIKFFLEIAALIIVVCYTRYAGQQAGAAINAADAAESAAITASRQLEMLDRPWIKEVVRPAANLLADRGAFSWAVTIRIDNIGRSVATNIYPRTELIAPKGGDFIDGPRKRVIELCKDASQQAANLKKDPTLWDTSVFPGDPVEVGRGPILWPKDVEAATIDGGKNLGKSVSLMLVGCIAYDYPTASKFHETGFVYVVVHNDDVSIPESARVFFSIGKTIPKDKLVMIKQGQLAD
jgi:hypothetical protein